MFIPPSEEILAVLPVEDRSDYTAMHTPNPDAEFITAWNFQAHLVHSWAKSKGWWDNEDADTLEALAFSLPESGSLFLRSIAEKLRRRNDGELIALCHTELSEMTEGLRTGNGPDDKIPDFSSAEAEAADVIIRLMDLSHARGWRVGEAVIAKMKMNHTRPYRHGKEF